MIQAKQITELPLSNYHHNKDDIILAYSNYLHPPPPSPMKFINVSRLSSAIVQRLPLA